MSGGAIQNARTGTSDGAPPRRDGAARSRDRIYYLTAPDAVRRFGSWCVTAGEARTPAGTRYPPAELQHPSPYRAVSETGRVLDELQLVYIADGSGQFEDANGRPRRVEPGSCLFLMPGVWHRYRPDADTGWHEYWVGVRGDPVLRAARALGLDGRGALIRASGNDRLVEVYRELLDLAAVHDTASHIAMVGKVLELLALVARGRRGDRRSQNGSDPVDSAIRVMRACVRDRLDLTQLIRETGLPEASFRRSFRRRTGSSPYRYFMTLKVNAVKTELARTEQPLKAIAAQLGFTDQYHLSRVFKDYTGVSPSRWRASGG
jgi:AraC-like DNA-binding protein